MKTKIIYISGNEVFDMADIRAAFEEVRAALALDNDTVLFGVPVDADDALATTSTQEETNNDTTPEIPAPQQEISQNLNDDIVAAPQVQAPVKKSRGRPAKKVKTDMATDAAISPEPAPVITAPDDAENVDATTEDDMAVNADADINDVAVPQSDEDNTDAADKSDGKIIPILSILAAKQDATVAAESIHAESDLKETGDVVAPETDMVASDAIINDINTETEIISTDDEIPSEPVSIDDMISDDAPVAQHEKTLEELLESMTPLREDHNEEQITPDVNDTDEIVAFDEITESDGDDTTDATLAQLANEFAQTEDKIITTPKNPTHGKIGKLKNILPFKKAKRDDTGLMGDLFGWAGIAANDEDFSMPGFFTGAAVKK